MNWICSFLKTREEARAVEGEERESWKGTGAPMSEEGFQKTIWQSTARRS